MLRPVTHREVRHPQISARYLADYMAASERARRTIIRGCRFQPVARVIQHKEARLAISRHFIDGRPDTAHLQAQAQRLRDRMADNDFDRDVLDHNADYIDRFTRVAERLDMPNADILPPGRATAIDIQGVRVTTDIHFRLRRVTRTNEVRVGAAMLRYAKDRALDQEVGRWQSAFVFGYLNDIGVDPGSEVERNLCLTIDAFSGVVYAAPGNAATRYRNMEAACATIAERWQNIPPPEGAIL